MERFANRVAIVTGGGGGIGETVIRRLYDEGASVVVADLSEEAAVRVADTLGDTSRVFAIAVDVTDRAAVDAMTSEAVKRFGKLDILINCAGIIAVGSVMEVDMDQWRRIHAVNLDGTLNAVQSFARIVKHAGTSASIVNFSSMAGIMGIPNRAAYVSAKHAICGLTREMAMEVSGHGIRVNAVAPGYVRTALTEYVFKDGDNAQKIAAAHPIGRAGRPEEIAAAVLFLASDDASFITGVILPVDGGFSAGKTF